MIGQDAIRQDVRPHVVRSEREGRVRVGQELPQPCHTVWLFGPIGRLDQYTVRRFPREDSGTEIVASKGFVGRDAALIAGLLGTRHHCVLMGNPLSSLAATDSLVREFEQLGVEFIPVGTPRDRDQFDIVICSQELSTRTWLGHIDPPTDADVSLIPVRTAALSRPAMIYADYWGNANTLAHAMSAMMSVAPEATAYVNVGDVSDVDEWLTVVRSLAQVDIAQASLLAPSSASDIHNATAEMRAAGDGGPSVCIFTRGPAPVILEVGGVVVEVPVADVEGALTTGSGAFFSSCLVDSVLRNGRLRDLEEARRAISAACEQTARLLASRIHPSEYERSAVLAMSTNLEASE